MKPALAFPWNDPDGTLSPHLQAILPDLKAHFEHAYICPSLSTLQQEKNMRQLLGDNFFTIFPIDHEMQVGERFAYLYQTAAETAYSEQVIHLCFPDRIAFALEGKYRNIFLADIDSLADADLPILYQRSELAWETHPQNYRQIEGIVMVVGHNLFGRELDYAWCHIAVQAKQLRNIMPNVKNPDLSMVAEVVYYLREEIKTRHVDWLAWEDPFIFFRDAAELKRERENSLEETNKRLNYVLPIIETLTRLSRNGRK